MELVITEGQDSEISCDANEDGDDDFDDGNNNNNNNNNNSNNNNVGRMEESRSVLKMLTGKPTEKRPLGRPRLRWEDNIRKDLKEIGINAGNWINH